MSHQARAPILRLARRALLCLAMIGSLSGCVYAPGPYGYADAPLYDGYYYPDYPGNYPYYGYYGPWGVVGHVGLHHRGFYHHGFHRGFRGYRWRGPGRR
jgi:hypothetical protein